MSEEAYHAALEAQRTANSAHKRIDELTSAFEMVTAALERVIQAALPLAVLVVDSPDDAVHEYATQFVRVVTEAQEQFNHRWEGAD